VVGAGPVALGEGGEAGALGLVDEWDPRGPLGTVENVHGRVDVLTAVQHPGLDPMGTGNDVAVIVRPHVVSVVGRGERTAGAGRGAGGASTGSARGATVPRCGWHL
jgi:hypothetical protein